MTSKTSIGRCSKRTPPELFPETEKGTGISFDSVVANLERESRRWPAPVITAIARNGAGPFEVLVATILSLRTKDDTTAAAAQRLFAKADTPAALAALPEQTVADLIYPVGFFRVKAARLRQISKILLDQHQGEVPGNMTALLSLPGVGRKTANLVLVEGFQKPAVCVDVHVHRISNRLGLVATRNPDETETALRRDLARRHWIRYNELLVAFGQHICRPVSPRCSQCPFSTDCPKTGVTKSR